MRVAVPRTSGSGPRARLGAALAVPALLALSAWAGAGPVVAADGHSYVTLDRSSSGGTVNLPSNGILAVVLQANAGTGYEWRTITVPSSAVIGAPADVSWPYTVPSSTMPGAPVAYVWYFPVAGPGTTTFSAGLFPPGVEQAAAETYTLDIVVRDAGGDAAALTGADCGQVVGVDVDGAVTLTLDSNASTGYTWKVVAEPAAWLMAQPGNGDYVAPPAGSPPGAGGQQVFAWKAETAGSTSVTVGYVPPGGTTADTTCGISVVSGAPVLPPDKGSAVGPGTGEPPTVGATPPPTSTEGDAAPAATSLVGLVAFVVFLGIALAVAPVLAHRRRRVTR